MESHARSILKAVTWRVTALLITTAVVWFATGKAELAATIGLLDTGIKLGVYYAHERSWLKVKFGLPRPSDYQI